MIDIKKVGENLQTEIVNRFQGAFWGPFILSWCIVNWKIILVIFSWNSKEIDDKIKYIENLFSWDFSWFGLGLSLGKLFIFPFFGSLVAIYLIPYLTRWFLRKQIDNKNKENEEYKKGLKSEIEVKDKELELQEKNEKIEKNSEEEFENFIKNYPSAINVLSDFIYKYSGKVRNANGGRNINSDELAFLDSYGVIEEDNGKYFITEKGKKFLQKSLIPKENISSFEF